MGVEMILTWSTAEPLAERLLKLCAQKRQEAHALGRPTRCLMFRSGMTTDSKSSYRTGIVGSWNAMAVAADVAQAPGPASRGPTLDKSLDQIGANIKRKEHAMKRNAKWLLGILILWLAAGICSAQTASSNDNAVIIVVDDSSSVLEAGAAAARRLEFAAAIISELSDGDLVNVVRFADSAKLVFPSWTLVAGQRESLKRALSAPVSVGVNTRITVALQTAFKQFRSLTPLKRRLMVFLISDGRFALDETAEALLLKFKQDAIPIYAISVIAGDPVRLQTLAALTGGAYLTRLDQTNLQRILHSTVPERVPFPWAEIKSQLKVELVGPAHLTEGETVALQAAIKFGEDPISPTRNTSTAWGSATVTVRRVALLVDGQPTGDMSFDLASGSYEFRLPSLSPGLHRVQAVASLLLQSGDAEHLAELPSPEQSLTVEAQVQAEPSGQTSWLLLGSGGLALLMISSLVLRRVRRRKKAWQPGQEFTFNRDRVTIGSSSESDLVVPDERVGEVHLSIQRDGSDDFKVKDESGLGVAVNSREVRWADLHDADRIEFGPYTLEFLVKNSGFTLKVVN